MRAAIELFVGIATLTGMFFAIDCTQHKPAAVVPSPPVIAVGACKAETRPQLLCDRVTRDNRECVICVEIACTTQTGLYCAVSCDDPACAKRP